MWSTPWLGKLRHISKNGRKKEEGRRKKEEGRREKGEGRREKGEGRREKGEGRREKGEGRREKGEGRREKVWEKEGGAASAPPGGRSLANVRLFFRHLGVDHGHGGHVDDI
jgi:hypothetical protein